MCNAVLCLEALVVALTCVALSSPSSLRLVTCMNFWLSLRACLRRGKQGLPNLWNGKNLYFTCTSCYVSKCYNISCYKHLKCALIIYFTSHTRDVKRKRRFLHKLMRGDIKSYHLYSFCVVTVHPQNHVYCVTYRL